MTSTFKAVAFDFDGTLVDSNDIKRRAFYEVSCLLGDVGDVVDGVLARKPGDRAAIFSHIVARARDAGRLPTTRSPESWVETLVASYTDSCERAIVACAEVPGMSVVLERLSSQRYALFINSATPLQALLAILRKRGLNRYFRAVYGTPSRKSENLERIMRDLGVAPAELLFVGDHEADRAAAEAAGCPFIGLSSRDSDYAKEPCSSIRDLTELESAMGSLAAAARKSA